MVGMAAMVGRHTLLALLLLTRWCSVVCLEQCNSDDSCTAQMTSLVSKLGASAEDMKSGRLTLQLLQDLREGITTGNRVELSPATRQHLEKAGSTLVGEVSVNAQHAATTSNASGHVQHMRSIAGDVQVKLFGSLQLKRAPGSSTKGAPTGPYPLLVIIDVQSRLWLVTMDDDVVLSGYDLGHPGAASIERIALSPNQDQHHILTADANGEMRVHDIKIIATREKKDPDAKADAGKSKKDAAVPTKLTASVNFTSNFFLPTGNDGQLRQLTAIQSVERSSQTYFVVGDSDGGLSVFYKNGTMKGRTVVTEDAGGVRGLLRGQSNTLTFWSSNLFGTFSAFQIDMQQAPCSGWNSPLHDLVLETSSSSNRVILALEDGDVLVYSTLKGKSKVCELALKFPHVSSVPFQLYLLKSYVLGLAMPMEGSDRLRELFFFNLAGMEAGYGAAPSRAVALQTSFKPQQPKRFEIFSKAAGTGGERSKSLMFLQMIGQPGLEIYDLNLKLAAPPKSAAPGAAGGASPEAESGFASLFNWVPKIGVFGVALIGVLIWNVRKVSGSKRQPSASFDFDNEAFAEKILESRRKRKEEAERASGAPKKTVVEMDEDDGYPSDQ
mmetsp:Transcript_30104/g.70189  ORF Transcript_30104/g.70189 Transcript_30104/m.70189 type:complete len:610 (+) Transcript_30104:133-1962(+)